MARIASSLPGIGIGDAVRVGVAVEHRDDRDLQLVRLLDRDRLLVRVDDEQDVGQAAHLLDAAERALELVAVARQLEQLALGEAGSALVTRSSSSRSRLIEPEMVLKLVSMPPSQRWLT